MLADRPRARSRQELARDYVRSRPLHIVQYVVQSDGVDRFAVWNAVAAE